MQGLLLAGLPDLEPHTRFKRRLHKQNHDPNRGYAMDTWVLMPILESMDED